MRVMYKHTNLVARDWRTLAEFYETVFHCVRVPPERNLSGEWLGKGAGVAGASLMGVHLRLPGYGDKGPTLEIYQYSKNMSNLGPAANREGFGHIAFEVDDVEKALERVKRHGGSAVGAVSSHKVDGVGSLTFVYAADPERNIIELQNWGSGPEPG